MVKGIDVSDNNGTLDWDAIKASGIEFAMIRTGYGSNYESQDDRQAIRNMQECERLGFPYGTYNYGYALNTDEAKSEAEHALRMVKDFNPKLGVYTDMEDADGYKVRHGLVPEENGSILTDFCIIFMDTVKAAGYETGTYANKNYFDSILQIERLANYPKWLAIWGPSECPSGDWSIWQFSSDGEVPGSNARTDMNYYMKDLPQKNVQAVDTNDYPVIQEWPIESPSTTYHIGDHVGYNLIYSESGAWESMNPLNTDGVITQIYEGSRNPYLLNDGTGFVNDACITGLFGEQPTPQVEVISVQQPIEESAPSFETVDVFYQVYANDKALPEVQNCQNDDENGFSGCNDGVTPIRGLKVRLSKGNVFYQAHILGRGPDVWNDEVENDSDWASRSDFSEDIDAVRIRLEGLDDYDVFIRVARCGGEYYALVKNQEDIAGVYGQAIARVQIYVSHK